MSELQLKAQQLAEMVGLIEDGTISGKIGKQILPDLLQARFHLQCYVCEATARALHMSCQLRQAAASCGSQCDSAFADTGANPCIDVEFEVLSAVHLYAHHAVLLSNLPCFESAH